MSESYANWIDVRQHATNTTRVNESELIIANT